MRIERRFTKTGQSPYAEIEFRKALSEIRNPDGSVVFRLDDIDVPAQFSQVAADILAQKYFRKAGVPARLKQDRGERRPLLPVALGPRRGRAGQAPRGPSATAPRPTRGRCSTGWPAPGPIGAGRAAISRPRTTRSPSATSSPTCSPPSAWRRTRRNGSTPACTGPTASTAPARAISMSTRSPAS